MDDGKFFSFANNNGIKVERSPEIVEYTVFVNTVGIIFLRNSF